MFPEKSVRVLKEAKNVIFDLTSRDEVACLLQSATMEAKKIAGRWQNKITTCVEQISLLGVIRKVSNRKTLTDETFCFVEKRLLSIFTFLLRETYCFFTSCWFAHNKLSWNVLLFSRNPIGQLCLGGPSYSSRAVRKYWQGSKVETNYRISLTDKKIQAW